MDSASAVGFRDTLHTASYPNIIAKLHVNVICMRWPTVAFSPDFTRKHSSTQQASCSPSGHLNACTRSITRQHESSVEPSVWFAACCSLFAVGGSQVYISKTLTFWDALFDSSSRKSYCSSNTTSAQPCGRSYNLSDQPCSGHSRHYRTARQVPSLQRCGFLATNVPTTSQTSLKSFKDSCIGHCRVHSEAPLPVCRQPFSS